MKRLALIACATALVACGTKKPAEVPPPPPAAEPAAPAPISMADLTGTWDVKSTAQGSDSALVTYTLTATADTTGWTVTFPGRKPMAVRVMASGDSITIDAAPFQSMLRKGVKVTTHSVARLVGGQLVGTTVAHYQTKSADSVATRTLTGTKKP
ncbi:MAG: hypothetical protein ACREL5_06280 [Gemmatimonadales bacterium]